MSTSPPKANLDTDAEKRPLCAINGNASEIYAVPQNTAMWHIAMPAEEPPIASLDITAITSKLAYRHIFAPENGDNYANLFLIRSK